METREIQVEYKCAGSVQHDQFGHLCKCIHTSLSSKTIGPFGGMYPTSSNLIPEKANVLVTVTLTDTEVAPDDEGNFIVVEGYGSKYTASLSSQFLCPGVIDESIEEEIRSLVGRLIEDTSSDMSDDPTSKNITVEVMVKEIVVEEKFSPEIG